MFFLLAGEARGVSAASALVGVEWGTAQRGGVPAGAGGVGGYPAGLNRRPPLLLSGPAGEEGTAMGRTAEEVRGLPLPHPSSPVRQGQG